MKKSLIAVSLLAMLSACGGGSSGSSNNGTNPNGNTGGNSGTGGTGGTGTTTTGMTEAFKVFGESWLNMQAVLNMHDLVIIAGNTGNCPKGGTVSFNGSITTMNNCVRRFPADNAYQGSFGGTPVIVGNLKTLAFQSNGLIYANVGNNPSVSQYAITNTSFTASEDSSNSSQDVTQIGNGSASFVVSNATTYALSAIASTVANNSSSLNSMAGFFYSKNGSAANRLLTTQNLAFASDSNGMTMRPTTGAYNVAVGGSSTVCVNVAVQMMPNNQLQISCTATNEKQIVNWTDNSVRTALNNAAS